MSLVHEFFLLPKKENVIDWEDWYSRNRLEWQDKIEIPDDIILYIFDSLNWVPTLNPETNNDSHGLNYYGVTLIEKDGAILLKRILESWISLFINGPSVFKLRGKFIWVEENKDDGYWQRENIEFERDYVIRILKKLKDFSCRLENDNVFIMHYGI